MKKLFTLLLALVATTVLWAHDFEVNGIYYNILTDKTNEVEVTSGSSKYSGSVIIRKTVTYNGTTYSVTSIGDKAFYRCYSLTSITILSDVTSIGDEAFYGCENLDYITIPNSVTSIGRLAFVKTGIYYNESKWKKGVFYISNCLIEAKDDISGAYIIKEGTRLIADDAFYDCSSLTSITIPNSVTSIGKRAFSGCSSLTSITIPNSVTSIGERAFSGCSSLPVENNLRYADTYLVEAVDNTLSTYSIKEGTKWIGWGAFYYCSSLTSITIPNSVISIGEAAFSGCSGLTSIVVEEGNTIYDSRDNCNAIIETATNTLISGCQNTTIPNSVTSIGDWAFEACSSLTSVTIPNSVTSIGEAAFNSSSGLTSITIPNSVTSIGNYAFQHCSGLTSVTCKAVNLPEMGEGVFWNAPTTAATLYVPGESLELYQAAEQWKEFGTILPLEEAPSAVDNVEASTGGIQKLLRNGKVIIIHDGVEYTIMGQEL